MRYQTSWGREYSKLCQYFMPLQDLILCLASPGEARRLHSQFGKISQPSQIPSYSLQLHPLVQYVKRAWNVSSSWCTTERVTRPVLMRPRSNVCTERSSIWCYPTNQGGPVTEHKQSCLSSWSLLGPSAYTKPRSTFTRGLRMDFQRGRMAAPSGRRFQMWPSRAKSYFAVGASVGV